MDQKSDYFTQVFSRDKTRMLLACGGNSCGVDLTVDDGAEEKGSSAVRFEVIYQPRNERGLAAGLARLLYETKVPLQSQPGSPRRYGHVELPYRLPPALLRECHFRVSPSTIDTPADHGVAEVGN
jgi:hypothetical protein